MKRREVFRIGAALAAAPAGAASLPAAVAPLAQATGPWQARALDDHQIKTVTQLADLILPDTDTPGAVKAGVVSRLDKILADGDPERRGNFLEAVAWIDGYAMRQHSKPFLDLSAAAQTAILDELDHGASADGRAGRGHFRAVKGAVTGVYYATETGFRELNKGGRVPRTYGCTHPEHK
ncbi:MAG: gluconate 2-dehydrogenase subunit 3 family protein [Bryobacteraceae bacterium]